MSNKETFEYYYFLIFFLIFFIFGCSSNIKINADPPEIKANGVDRSKITVKIDQADGTEVQFNTDLGTFVDEEGQSTYVTRYLSGGSTYAELISSEQPGSATVTVTYYTTEGDYGTSSIRIPFYLLPVSGNNISLTCDRTNIGAFREPQPEIGVRCELIMNDREGDKVKISSLSPSDWGFVAEAGSFSSDISEDDNGRVFVTYYVQGGNSEPVDTEPLSGEPSRPDDFGQRDTRNPRDGLVTLLAYVKGEEGFQDTNSNGVWDSSEIFYDIGEPFLDVDDDGIFDELKGDTYIDVDNNGRYTEANGIYDKETYVWAIFKILWTGQPHEKVDATRIETQGNNFEIPSGETQRFNLYLVDQNLNPISGDESFGDNVTLIINCGSCVYNPTEAWILTDQRGFYIDDDGKISGNIFNTPMYEFFITNQNESEVDETYDINVTVYSSAGTDSTGACCIDQNSYTLTNVSGKLKAGTQTE